MEPWQPVVGVGSAVVPLERLAAAHIHQDLGLTRLQVEDIILTPAVDLASPSYFPSLALGEGLAVCSQS